MPTEFPIMSKTLPSIPWAMIAPHARQAHLNHFQTLERLAERGGLSAGEAILILDDMAWPGKPYFILPRQRDARDEWDREQTAELRGRVEEFLATTGKDPGPEDQPEGDCPDCEGTGEVCCNCDDPGCTLCVDGMRACGGCDGSGYTPTDLTEEFDF